MNTLETVKGTVERYAGNGRKLGYPTANLSVATKLDDGVYFGFASLAIYANHPALIFVGTPTTLGDTVRRVEAYLLDIPDKDYYGETLELNVEHFHRLNQTFENVQELKVAMKNDESVGRKWFSEHDQKAQ